MPKKIVERCPECNSTNIRAFRVEMIENEDGSITVVGDAFGCDSCGNRGSIEEFCIEVEEETTDEPNQN